MSSSLFKAAILALAFTDTASAALEYTLAAADTYTGTTFWDGFNFITTADPNFGFVSYQSKAVAESSQFGGPLIKTFDDGSNYMGVDYWNKYPVTAGRPSVRIETQKSYQYGLFVADLAHMPASVCGTWPAFWTVNHVDYPSNGEIDILENINENTQSLETLHTTAGCSVVGNMLGKQQNGDQNSYNCDDQATSSNYGSQSTYQGCSATNSDTNSYGSAFNANSGGVYAMEWTSEVIQIWNFGPNDIPSNLASGKPDTSTWGIPQFTTAQGSCDIDSHFKNQQVVFNTDFCGTYAGLANFWEETSCYKSNPTLYPDCNSYVAANPEMYKESYWQINSLKVYQKNYVSSSSSGTHSTTTTSKSSTSSTSSTTSTTITSSTSSNTGVSSLPTSSVRYSNTSTSVTPYTTSTIYSTRTSTISDCPETVTNCPYKTHPVTTEIVDVYTTVCPVTATETSSGVIPSKSPPSSESMTLTIYETKVYTITSCAPTVTNCPAKLGQVTTETVSYTTVCASSPTTPVVPVEAVAGSVAPTAAISSAAGVVSFSAAYSTVAAGVAGASSAGGAVAPSQSLIYSSGAGERTVKGVLVVFLVGFVLLV